MMEIHKLNPNQIFVFGSNLAGRHGLGAALTARQKFGAIYGQGEGIQGQSYAIPTKDINLKTLPLSIIQEYINKFLEFASKHPEYEFLLTPIGCGLAGYSVNQLETILPEKLPDNIIKTWEIK